MCAKVNNHLFSQHFYANSQKIKTKQQQKKIPKNEPQQLEAGK